MKKVTVFAGLLVICAGFQSCGESVSANACSTGGVVGLINSLVHGGIADLTACGSMTLEGPIIFGSATAPVTLKLGAGTITFSNSSGDGFVLAGSGSRLIGEGPLQTLLTTDSGFSGDVVHVEPGSDLTTSGVDGIELGYFGCDVSNSPTAVCVNAVAVRHASSLHNLRLMNMTGIALALTTSSVPGGRISNGTSVRDVYIQTSANPLTSDTVILKGNAIQFDSNNFVYTPAPQGAYRGLVITPSATSQGDGRGNNVSHSVFEGYGTCLSLESPSAASAGPIGNVITANWFEKCGLAYEFTGADAMHTALNNKAMANYFASTTSHVARLEFANDNFVQEITNGNPGTVTLTSDSTNNIVFVRGGNAGAVVDSGFGNVVYSNLSDGVHLNRDLHVGGTLYKAAGSFRIDHPLDPERKYLQHSFVESPDMLDVYNGVATLDRTGKAEVELPEYFQALNRDFRYQLTPIGNYAPLYVAREVAHNTFAIAGGRPGQRVSWQVTGIRHDSYANSHRIQVEGWK